MQCSLQTGMERFKRSFILIFWTTIIVVDQISNNTFINASNDPIMNHFQLQTNLPDSRLLRCQVTDVWWKIFGCWQVQKNVSSFQQQQSEGLFINYVIRIISQKLLFESKSDINYAKWKPLYKNWNKFFLHVKQLNVKKFTLLIVFHLPTY